MTDAGSPIMKSVADPLFEEARRLGVYAIVREQVRRVLGVTAQNGVIEEVGSSHGGGVGLQTFTEKGLSAFGCSDGFEPEEVRTMLRRTAAAAAAAGAMGGEPDGSIHSAKPLVLHLP